MAVGILGGGQLALMLAESLDHLGQDVVILESDEAAPCSQRRSRVLARAFDDPQRLREFFSQVDVATFDSENIPAGPLTPWAHMLRPSIDVLRVAQNRADEKRFLAGNGFRPVAFDIVAPEADVRSHVHAFGFPCVAKAALGGYDGKGQFVLRTPSDVQALPNAAPGGWVLEELLELRSEISCIVARGTGAIFSFPVFENIHRHHVLDATLLPARVPQTIQTDAAAAARRLAQCLDVTGLLTVEFFVGTGRDGVERLYVNELAPRVHNSGHVTRQACSLSQFDALARIMANIPLTEPSLRTGAFCMGQLLGDIWLSQGRSGGPLDLQAIKDFPEVLEVYLYGKKEARRHRKMGHFVVRSSTPDLALALAQRFREALEGKRA